MASEKHDVVVIGAGVFGLAVALAAQARGRAVLVLDREAPGAGASGGIVGALSPHVPDQWNPKKAFQRDALLAAPAYWRGIEANSGLSTGFGALGRLMPLRTEDAVARAEARAAAARENWPAPHRWEVVGPDAPPPGLIDTQDILGFVRETLSARLFPQRACLAMAEAVRRGGGFIAQADVQRVEPGAVVTSSRTLSSPRIVIAAGVAGFPLLAPLHGGAAAGSGVKGQAAMVEARLPENCPVLFDDGVYVIHHGQGLVAVGSTSERQFSQGDQVDGALDALLERARALSPALRGAPVRTRWAGVRPKARRRDPMLGPVPGADGVFAALGGFKIGFGIAPRVGEVIAQMLDGDAPELPPSFTIEHHLSG